MENLTKEFFNFGIIFSHLSVVPLESIIVYALSPIYSIISGKLGFKVGSPPVRTIVIGFNFKIFSTVVL